MKANKQIVKKTDVIIIKSMEGKRKFMEDMKTLMERKLTQDKEKLALLKNR